MEKHIMLVLVCLENIFLILNICSADVASDSTSHVEQYREMQPIKEFNNWIVSGGRVSVNIRFLSQTDSVVFYSKERRRV